MNNEQETSYNPLNPIAAIKDIGNHIIVHIDRRPEDNLEDWLAHYRLIENVVCRDSEVDQSAMDPSGQLLYIALKGELYDVDELKTIDARVRQLIARVTLFNFNP